MPFGGAGHSSGHIFHVPVAKPWHNAPEYRTLLVPYPLLLTDTTDFLSEKRPTKFTDLHSQPETMPSMYHQSLTILLGLLFHNALKQIAVTWDRTCNPQMREQAL